MKENLKVHAQILGMTVDVTDRNLRDEGLSKLLIELGLLGAREAEF